MESKTMSVVVNGKALEEYFPASLYRNQVLAPIKKVELESGLAFTVVVSGGGTSSQAEAIRHGISRALVLVDIATRSTLKRAGYLMRDPRSKERKKPGLKKARKSPAWSKR
jgi:small subunit ribosomal protein S9